MSSPIMEHPSDEELELIQELTGEIMKILYDQERKVPRHVVLKTLVSCMIGSINELQEAENKLTGQVLTDNGSDPIEVSQIIKESNLEGWKNKVSQIILLLIGHIGDRKTRQDQMDIMRNCLSFMQDIGKPNIIEP